MDAESILMAIRDIADEPARNQKQSILAKIIDDDLGKWIVSMTYDPFKTYGIKCPMPEKVEGGRGNVEFRKAMVQPILHQLATRELTGNAAQAELFATMQALNETGRNLLYRIVSKDLKCGIAHSSIEMVAPGLIPSFAVMRAQTYEEGFVKSWPQKGEFKLDGQRNTFLCKDGSGAFFTRSGRHVPALDFFVPSLLKVGHAASKTELGEIVLDENGGLSFMADGEAIMGLFEETGAFRRKDQDAKGSEIHLYDFMSYADFDATGSVGAKLTERRSNLSKFVRLAKSVLSGTDNSDMIQMVPQYFLNSHDDVEKLFALSRAKTMAEYLSRGDKEKESKLLKTTIDKATGKPKVLEGIMIKNPDAMYQKKKSRDWLKMKAEETLDLKIIGAYPGEPGTKYENCLGGFVLDHLGVRVRCGGGFSDAERIQIWSDWMNDYDENSEDFETDKDAIIYKGNKNTYDDADFDFLGRLAEIEFNEVTPDGSLRHPRFVRFRDDKAREISK